MLKLLLISQGRRFNMLKIVYRKGDSVEESNSETDNARIDFLADCQYLLQKTKCILEQNCMEFKAYWNHDIEKLYEKLWQLEKNHIHNADRSVREKCFENIKNGYYKTKEVSNG